MKKIILTILTVLALTGCNNKTLNLNDVESNLDKLSDGKFSLTMVDSTKLGFKSELEYIYDFDYKDTLNLDKENVNVENTLINYNKDTKELLAIIEPTDKKEVEKQMNDFCDDKCFANTFNEYTIFIKSEDSEKIFGKIINISTPIFNEMLKVDDDMLKEVTGIDSSNVEEYLFKVPQLMTSSSTYMIIKPKAGEKENIKEKMDEYMEKQMKSWEMYLPDQYELVKNRLEKEYGDYLIYIVSSDNDLVYKEITK